MSVRVAVVGAGHWGPNLVRAFAKDGAAEVAWVVDLDTDRLERVQGRFPWVPVTTDLDAVLADESVDAVAVATPACSHFKLVSAALNAGKHVLVEKPLTDDAALAEELVGLARRRRLVLLVGHVYLYNPGVRWAQRFIRGGGLGRLRYLSATRTNMGPVRRDVNAAWDLAAHDVSVASCWVGAEPLWASAVGGAWLDPSVDDAAFATLCYPGDVLAHLHVSWANPLRCREVTAVGERGVLTFDDADPDAPVRVVTDGATFVPPLERVEPLRVECDDFLASVERGQAPLVSGGEAVAVVRALEAVTASMNDGGARKEVEA